MKHQSENLMTRRRFLRRSAATAVGIYSASRTDTARAAYDVPITNYPWDVEIDPRGRITLHLLELVGVDAVPALFFEVSFLDVLLRMDAVLPTHNNGDFGGQLIRLQSNKSKLQSLVEGAINGILADGLGTKTYEFFATTNQQTWGPEALQALRNLDSHISVPALRSDPAKVTRYFEQSAALLAEPSRTFRDLFATSVQNTRIWKNYENQIAAFRRGRELGVFWCSPSADTSVGVKEGQQGYMCVNGNCVLTNNPDDYCQEVDGHCTPMS